MVQTPYSATMCHGGKPTHLGLFASAEAAALRLALAERALTASQPAKQRNCSSSKAAAPAVEPWPEEQAEALIKAVEAMRRRDVGTDELVHGWRLVYTLRAPGGASRGDMCAIDPRDGQKIFSLVGLKRKLLGVISDDLGRDRKRKRKLSGVGDRERRRDQGAWQPSGPRSGCDQGTWQPGSSSDQGHSAKQGKRATLGRLSPSTLAGEPEGHASIESGREESDSDEADTSEDYDSEDSDSNADDDVYTVDRILAKRWNGASSQTEYFCRWEGWGEEHNTWEPAYHILDKSLIAQFEECEHEHMPFDTLTPVVSP